MSKRKFVLQPNTDTQRVTVELGEHTSLVSKEWRKSTDDNWVTGKGIRISNERLQQLGEIVGCQDEQQRNTLLSQFEQVREDEQN